MPPIAERKTLAQALKKQSKSTGPPHIIVKALAGCGKTTCLIGGVYYTKGLKYDKTPSPQQLAVWESMALSRKEAHKVGFVAFNAPIAAYMKTLVPPGCDARTLHSLGQLGVIRGFGEQEPIKEYTQELVARLLCMDVWSLRKENPTLMRATEALVSKCKLNLAEPHTTEDGRVVGWEDILDQLSSHYDIELGDERDMVYELVPQILEMALKPEGKITFDDQIWLCVKHNLPINKYDLLMVDESQDLNRCQQALALKAGKRLVLCGDINQSIYGFAGADTRSMIRMEETLRDSDRGVIVLPLTVTRRCGRAIVKYAQRYVSEFEAHESNCEGKVSTMWFKEGSQNWYGDKVESGDMILCRTNAPLISQCFKFIKLGKKATIQGRDVAKGLIYLAKRCEAYSFLEMRRKVSHWKDVELQKENQKKFPSEHRINAITDRAACVECFIDGAMDIYNDELFEFKSQMKEGDRRALIPSENPYERVVKKINEVFTDDGRHPGIRFSSIHKAKGLEARRVFILQLGGIRRSKEPSLHESQQELNLEYVAITRAIEELVFVVE